MGGNPIDNTLYRLSYKLIPSRNCRECKKQDRRKNTMNPKYWTINGNFLTFEVDLQPRE